MVPNEDIAYFSKQSNIDMIISGMTALLRDTDDKIEKMESQKWYQRMIKTVTGKNKANKEEIKQNHDKLCMYMSESISELYRMKLIDDKIIASLGTCINELYCDQLRLKHMLGAFVNKLNEKIDSIDAFNMLNMEINQGVYRNETPLLSMCQIISQYDNRILKDDRKLELVKRSMIQAGILDEKQKAVSMYLKEICEISLEDVGLVYLQMDELGNHNSFIARILASMIENYHFLADSERKLKSVDSLIDIVIKENYIDVSETIDMNSIYDEFLDCKKDIIDAIDTDITVEDKQINQSDSIQENDKEESAYGYDQGMNLEDYYITDKLVVEGSYNVSDMRVHIKSDVKCEGEGTLSLNNCEIIFYGKSTIWLSEYENLNCNKCTIRKDIEHFSRRVNVRGRGGIFIKNCLIENCVEFLHADTVSIEESNIRNCFQRFIDAANLTIKNCRHVNSQVLTQLENYTIRHPQTGAIIRVTDPPYYIVTDSLVLLNSSFENRIGEELSGIFKLEDEMSISSEGVNLDRINKLVYMRD